MAHWLSCLTNTDHDSKKGRAHFYPSNNGQQEYKSPKRTGIPQAGSIRHFLTLLLNSHSTLTFGARRTAPLIWVTHRASWGGLQPEPLHSPVARCRRPSVSLTHKSIVSWWLLPNPGKEDWEFHHRATRDEVTRTRAVCSPFLNVMCDCKNVFLKVHETQPYIPVSFSSLWIRKVLPDFFRPQPLSQIYLLFFDQYLLRGNGEPENSAGGHLQEYLFVSLCDPHEVSTIIVPTL